MTTSFFNPLFDPFSDMFHLQRNIDRAFNSYFGDFGWGGEKEEGSLWSPRLDIKETDKLYVINVEVPGVKKEDIKIRIKGDYLEIEGEMKKTTESKDEKYHRIERQSGKYFRKKS